MATGMSVIRKALKLHEINIIKEVIVKHCEYPLCHRYHVSEFEDTV